MCRVSFFALGGDGKLAVRVAKVMLCVRRMAMGMGGNGRRENRATESIVKPEKVAIA